MNHVLLTGFEPFGAHAHNVSERVARMLDGFAGRVRIPPVPKDVGPACVELSIQSRVLPVDAAGGAWVAGELESAAVDAVVHLGLAESARAIRIERRAVNVLDMRAPDNAGRQVRGATVEPERPPELRTTAATRMLQAAVDAGLAVWSEDAGTYVCNETYYRTLSAIHRHALRDRHGRLLPALFVHLPPESATPFELQCEIVPRLLALAMYRPTLRQTTTFLTDDAGRLLATEPAPSDGEGEQGGWRLVECPQILDGETEDIDAVAAVSARLGVPVTAVTALPVVLTDTPEHVLEHHPIAVRAQSLALALADQSPRARWLTAKEAATLQWHPELRAAVEQWVHAAYQ